MITWWNGQDLRQTPYGSLALAAGAERCVMWHGLATQQFRRQVGHVAKGCLKASTGTALLLTGLGKFP